MATITRIAPAEVLKMWEEAGPWFRQVPCFGIHIPYAATVALSLGANAQVDRLKRLMVHAIERREGSHWLCRIGTHSMAWNLQLHIGRKLGRPWSRYQL